jgi:hypothetical protein
MRIRIRVPQVLVAVAILAFGSVAAALRVAVPVRHAALPVVRAAALHLSRRRRARARRRLLRQPDSPRRDWLALLGALRGVASALWQQFYAVSQLSCDRTLAERIITGLHLDRLAPDLFIAYASCADAAVDMAGVPFAIWSCALFVLLALLIAWTLRTADARRTRA